MLNTCGGCTKKAIAVMAMSYANSGCYPILPLQFHIPGMQSPLSLLSLSLVFISYSDMSPLQKPAHDITTPSVSAVGEVGWGGVVYF